MTQGSQALKNVWNCGEAVALWFDGFPSPIAEWSATAESIPSKKSPTRHQSAQTQDSEFAYKV